MYGIPGPRESKITVIAQLIAILVIFPICIALTAKSCANPQEEVTKRRMYKLESIPYYDSLGNLYGDVKYYDHIPTHQDTLDFEAASDAEIKKNIKTKINNGNNQP